jgi:hypothetical protein
VEEVDASDAPPDEVFGRICRTMGSNDCS